jgi:hypothetical protein
VVHLILESLALPGVSIKFDRFIPAMWKAVRLGFVQAQHAEFVHLGLRWGFEVGLHPGRVLGHRFFKNYESSTAEAARARVTDARKVFLLSHRTVPNEAGDHRAARTPPWQGADRLRPPYERPPQV